jgi:hypothetical protein
VKKERIGISAGDYEGFIKEYARRVRDARPATITHEREIINLTELDNPNAPLIKKYCYELINLSNLEELLDPRDPRFRTHRFIDMSNWISPLDPDYKRIMGRATEIALRRS